MALLSASDFTGYSDSFAAPAGFNDPIFSRIGRSNFKHWYYSTSI